MLNTKRNPREFILLSIIFFVSALLHGCTVVEINEEDIDSEAGLTEQSPEIETNEMVREGVKLLSEDRFRDAEELFRTVLQTEPANRDAALPLGYCLIRSHRFGEADSLFSAFIERYPDSKEAFLGAAVARHGLGDRERAECAVAEGLKLLPEGPEKEAWKIRWKHKELNTDESY